MNRLTTSLCGGILAIGLFSSGVHAAGNPPQSTHTQQATDWSQQDTAAYVVSTVNLLHDRTGRPLAAILTQSADVSRFEVWAVIGQQDVYVIQLKDDYGKWLGALVYRMGWMRPMSASALTDRLGVRHAWHRVLRLCRLYPKKLIGTFGSTLPA